TYMSFILIGIIPLLLYVWDYLFGFNANLFIWTCIFTSFGFILIGFLKTYVTQTSKLKGVLETLTLGLIAAAVSYYVGDLLEHLLSA
ncbi:MAG: VIT1/CCC1 transporter family protein, partial [Winogradskyella sp.]|nr:VIT1/CCC1 transporter family protein [Winogradskyella sp.]